MAHAAFDTLSAAQRLEKEFGFPPKQAEGAAKLVHEHLVGTVATKDDIAAVKGELKAEIAAVKSDLKWIKGIGAAILAVLVLPWLTELAARALN